MARKPAFVRVLTLIVALLTPFGEAGAHNRPQIDSISPAQGRPGDVITITGRGFGFVDAQVFVDKVRASVISANATTIRFLIPDGVRRGKTKVTVRTDDHHQVHVRFTVLGPAPTVHLDSAAAVTAVTPRSGGVITTAGANGIAYSLTIPDGALAADTTITITPVASIADFHLRGGILAAVQFEPEGLQFRQPATLTLTLASPPMAGLGLIGFTMQNDGSGFEPVPFTRTGSTLSLTVPHFTVVGVGSGVCNFTIVTSEVGREACDDMNASLNFVERHLGEDGGLLNLPRPLRVQLASEINDALRNWLDLGILPALENAKDPENTSADVDASFDTAFREFLEITGILQILEALDVGDAVADQIEAAETLMPQALVGRQKAANAHCLADRGAFMVHIDRVLVLANSMDLYSVPVDPATRGVTCVTMRREVTFPDVVPAGGATLDVTAQLLFNDGAPLPPVQPPPVVRITLVPGNAVADEPLVAESEFQASFTTHVRAKPAVPTEVSFTLEFLAPRVGLRFDERVVKCRAGSPAPAPPPASAPAAASETAAFAVLEAEAGEEQGPVCAGLRVHSGVLTTILLVSAAGQTSNPRDDRRIPAEASGTFDLSVPVTSVSAGGAVASASAAASQTITPTAEQGLSVTAITEGTYDVSLPAENPPGALGNAQAAASVSIELLVPHTYTLSLTHGFSDPAHVVRITARIVHAGAVLRELADEGTVTGVLEPGLYSILNSCAGVTRNGPGEMRCSMSFTVTPQ